MCLLPGYRFNISENYLIIINIYIALLFEVTPDVLNVGLYIGIRFILTTDKPDT